MTARMSVICTIPTTPVKMMSERIEVAHDKVFYCPDSKYKPAMELRAKFFGPEASRAARNYGAELANVMHIDCKVEK